jgi:hypothetical protein
VSIHDLRSFKEPRARRHRAAAPPLAKRLQSGALGLLFVCSGVVLTSFALEDSWDRVSFRTIELLGIASFVALFGSSMVWQALKGQPSAHGFFIRWMLAVTRRFDATHALLGVLGIGVLVLVVGLLSGRAAETSLGSTIVLGWFAFHLQVLFHEGGHLFAASGCHYGPYRVAAGIVDFSLRGDRWVFSLNREWGFVAGGAVFYIPPSHRRWAHDFYVVAAGPIATAVLLYACSSVSAYTGSNTLLHTFVMQNAGFGALALLVNLLPLRTTFNGLQTDGYQLLQLVKQL